MGFIRTNWVRLGFVAVVICALLAALASAQGARAATTYTVNTTADTVDTGGCVTVSTCSLRDAVIAADDNGGGTIVVPAGTYTLTIPTSGNTGDPNTGDLDIDNGADVTIAGAGAGETVIDPNQIDRAFSVADGATLDISDVTIEDGSAVTGLDEGGAIYSDGTLSVSDSTLDHNDAETGGDIYVDSDAASTTISDSTLSNSYAGVSQGEVGGAVDLAAGTLTVTGSTFSNDSAGGDAGAIEADGGDVSITDSIFSGDSSGYGGAIEVDNSPTTISSSTFSDDTAEGGFCDAAGGAIADDDLGGLSISSSLFDGDAAGTSGGAIADGASDACAEVAAAAEMPAVAPAADTLSISDTEITGSSAPYGGGLALNGGDSVSIENSTVDHNTAAPPVGFEFGGGSGVGGGVYLGSTTGSVLIEDTTISDNDAGSGAGVYFDDDNGSDEGDLPAQFTNDTIADNTSGNNGGDMTNGAGIYDAYDAYDGTSGGFVNTLVADNVGGDCNTGQATGAADEGNNLDSDGSCFGADDGGQVVTPDATTSSAALDLSPLQDNGGMMVGAPGDQQPLLTQLPGAGSSAINAGSNAACPSTDERGTPSPYNGGCDIGADEVAPAALSIGDTAASTGTPGIPFNDDITVSNAGPAPSGQTVLTFTVPAGETFYGASPAQGTCAASGSTVTCDLGDIDSGASTSLTLVVAGNANGSFTNTVSATNVEASTATGSATTVVSSSSTGGQSTVTTSSSTTVTNSLTTTIASTTPALNQPTAVTGVASKLEMTGSTVNGEVTTGGASTTYFFEYGKTTRYGYVTPVRTTGSNQAVSEKLANLTPGTVYHYRLIAINAEGTATGKDKTFRTPGPTSLGALLLDDDTLLVSGGRIYAKFTCDSKAACVFRWTVVASAEVGDTGSNGPVLVTDSATPFVTIGGHQTKTLSARVTTSFLALLRARDGLSAAKLTSRPKSGQTGLIVPIHVKF